jgi:hypothetical protein
MALDDLRDGHTPWGVNIIVRSSAYPNHITSSISIGAKLEPLAELMVYVDHWRADISKH